MTRIGINGMGRVGRAYLRLAAQTDDLEVVAVNDLVDITALARLVRRDSTFGPFPATVEVIDESTLLVGDRKIAVTAEPEPRGIRWGELGVDVVVESTGRFRTRDLARRHRVVSNASCTTNCVAPMVKVLHEAFGIERGFMTTVHAYTNDQNILDAPHKDARRARAGAVNIIPTTTGAAKAVGLVLPDIAGRLDGVALRVPVVDGSLVDLGVLVDRYATVDEVNSAFQAAAAS